jgi:hypothetical protein
MSFWCGAGSCTRARRGGRCAPSRRRGPGSRCAAASRRAAPRRPKDRRRPTAPRSAPACSGDELGRRRDRAHPLAAPAGGRPSRGRDRRASCASRRPPFSRHRLLDEAARLLRIVGKDPGSRRHGDARPRSSPRGQVTLFPISLMAAAPGPMKTIRAFAQASGNWGFSERTRSQDGSPPPGKGGRPRGFRGIERYDSWGAGGPIGYASSASRTWRASRSASEKDGHRPDPHLPAGSDDPHGDLAAVRDQDLPEHPRIIR